MAAVPLSLLVALLWGTADFIGALLSRRNPVPSVMVIFFGVGLALPLAVGLATGEPLPPPRAIVLALAGGTLGAAGLGCFYVAMARGKVGVVAPIAASGVAIPVVVGLAGGDTLATVVAIGMALAVAGIILASVEGSEEELHEDTSGGRRVVAIALLAAAGFGCFLVFTRPAYEESILWTLVFARALAFPAFLAVVLARRLPMPEPRDAGLAALGGSFDLVATVLVGLALDTGALSLVAVLTALYPVVAGLLAFALLKERLRPVQFAGATLALGGVLLIVAG